MTSDRDEDARPLIEAESSVERSKVLPTRELFLFGSLLKNVARQAMDIDG